MDRWLFQLLSFGPPDLSFNKPTMHKTVLLLLTRRQLAPLSDLQHPRWFKVGETRQNHTGGQAGETLQA